jgi:uncharacterized protein (DUF736 family)
VRFTPVEAKRVPDSLGFTVQIEDAELGAAWKVTHSN